MLGSPLVAAKRGCFRYADQVRFARGASPAAIDLGVDVNVWSVPAAGAPFTATFQDFNLP